MKTNKPRTPLTASAALYALVFLFITLQNAFRKALNDSEFHKEFLKLVGDEVEPVLPEELTKIIRETPRDAEVINLLKILAGAGALPPR